MKALVAMRTGAAAGRDRQPRPETGFSDGCYRVDVAGTGAALAVDDDFVVVVIGRIDALPGHPTDGPAVNDAASVLAAWRHRGADSLVGAAGDFLVLCYDRRSTVLSVVRDIVGAVPAYLVGGATQVVATSLAAALTATEGVTADRYWMRAYLAGQWPSEGRTPYEEIELLAPGHLARVDGGKAWEIRRLDDWQWVGDVPPGLDESAARFRVLFDRAVARRLAPVGGRTAVTTSGGLDSSSVLVTARHVAREQRLLALALAFTDRRGDERSYQQAVAARAGVQLEWIMADETGGPFGDDPAEVIEEHSGPPLAGNWFLHAALRHRAEELGVTRVLDGEDGDGVVGGSLLYLADLLGRGRVLTWTREVRSVSRAFGLDTRRVARTSVHQTRLAVRAGQAGRSYESSVRGLVLGGYLSGLTAESYRMWSALPGGIGHPFLDRHVMEYALSVPTPQRIQHGCTKVLLRRAMGDRLPEIIARRTGKANISSAFIAGMRRAGVHVETGRRMADEILRRLDPEWFGPAGQGAGRSVNLDAQYREACVGYWLSTGRVRGVPLAPPRSLAE